MNVIENNIAEKFDVIDEDDNVIKVVGNINTVVAIS